MSIYVVNSNGSPITVATSARKAILAAMAAAGSKAKLETEKFLKEEFPELKEILMDKKSVKISGIKGKESEVFFFEDGNRAVDELLSKRWNIAA